MANAQTDIVQSMMSSTNSTALDTANNTTAKSQVLKITGNWDVITIVTTVTEINGATAGTVKLYGSLDGQSSTYALIDTNYFSPADQTAAQSYKWELDKCRYVYYKTTFTPTGTMSAKFASTTLRRK